MGQPEPNHPAPGRAGFAPQLRVGHHRPGLPEPSEVGREPTTPMRNAFLLSTTVFIAFATAGYCQNGSARAVVTNRVPVRAISLFFGPPANDEAERKMREITGGNPYNPEQAQSIEEVRKRAIDAIKQEGRPIDEDYECAANIEMTTGKCTLLLNKTGAPHYSVNFDSSGKITYVGGASGPHGEGGWGREYTRGQRGGAASRSQPIRSETNRPSAAAASSR